MIVVSDTSPLTALMTIGKEAILQRLFEIVYIPQAVYDELIRGHANLPPFVKTTEVHDRAGVERLARQLDVGEAEAILLAKELRADLLLMDEKIGRRVAIQEGVRVVGLMGVLILAKRNGLVASVRSTIISLRHEAGFRVGDDVVEAVLEEAGEA